MTATAEELARLTGLDAPTISEQVLPHLDSYNAPEPLRLYLEVCSCTLTVTLLRILGS